MLSILATLDEMLSDSAPKHGDLMRSAVKYFDHFWTQVFRYQKDGEYTIDNNLAERFIRPLTRERKNSLFFGSHKMARVSAAYHSVISTCKFHGISILEYLKKFFKEIVAGKVVQTSIKPSVLELYRVQPRFMIIIINNQINFNVHLDVLRKHPTPI